MSSARPATTREVVRDPDQRRAGHAAQLLRLRQYLPLDGHVERRGRLVRDDDVRLVQQRDGDGDALAHPAGELVRVAPQPLVRARDADLAERVARPLPRLFPRTRSCACTVSIICVSIRRTGLSVIIGSWKIMAMRLPRSARISSSDSWRGRAP
jgi:hypothetical protein